MSPHEIRVAVIDDHDAIQAGVQTWFAASRPPVELVGGYTTTAGFLAAHGSPASVDVVVLDLELRSRRPDFDSVPLISKGGHPVVVYSHIVHNEVILRCLDLGAHSYIAKDEGRRHLLAAVRAAAAGSAFVAPRMAGAIAEDNAGSRPELTAREREVLVAWFQTESKELVARSLFVSTSTVRTYLQRVRAKYAAVGRPAPTKAALVARAIQDGIIGVDEL